ncbi:unnamed protein product [Discosporangium mesarthrocarpum]
MVSVERVLEYCRVPQEASLRSDPGKAPPKDWPSEGNIEARSTQIIEGFGSGAFLAILDLTLRYRQDLPAVLKGLSLFVKGGSRVGVVGRTGAGKSSLISALFRLVEQGPGCGTILIDGVDTSQVGLHDLRPRLSVIPQTPFLFSGSVRLNLDPFYSHTDAEIWSSLEAVQMKDHIAEQLGGLDAAITEGGQNLSVGQRQLLCLARAVLQRSQILVMDEATANIDQKNDSLIQDAVRTEFQGRTVVMIAHRLNTIIDCDQVIVLVDGKVVESGHPHELLSEGGGRNDTEGTELPGEAGAEKMDGTFKSMVLETGPEASAELRRLAQEAWEGRHGADGGETGKEAA